MNKIFKNLIVVFVVICTISNISFATNVRPANAKGTVSGNGTQEDPFKLVMGEPLIDLYYTDETKQYVHFEFIGGSFNAANYMLDHNADKKRIRFTLIGTDESSLRVTAEEGLNYLQTGAFCYAPTFLDKDKSGDGKDVYDLQTPFYSIESKESFTATRSDGKQYKLEHTTDLGNGYLTATDNLITANVSTYATSYVFSKSNLPYSGAYNLSNEQLNLTKTAYKFYKTDSKGKEVVDYTTRAKFSGDGTIVETKTKPGSLSPNAQNNGSLYEYYNNLGNVRVIYCFNGTSSEIADSLGEKAGPIESFFTKILTSVGDVFVKVSGIGKGLNSYDAANAYVTIDSLIFNEYPNTIVDFFGDTGYTNETARGVINVWFKIFKAWALIVYIILLAYIGIKTVLVSGTAEQKKVKGMLEGWIVGLLLMFFLPFLFKYLIVINDTVVDIIRVNSKYSVHAYYTFEDLYAEEQEDGEDSTTSVIDKLKNSREYFSNKIEDLETKSERVKESYEEIQREMQSETITGYFEEVLVNGFIDRSKKGIDSYLVNNNLKITKNGIEMTSEQFDTELSNLVKTFFTNEENRENFVNHKDLTRAIAENEALEAEVIKYCEELKIISNDGATASAEVLSEIQKQLYALAANILPRECSEILVENLQNNYNKVLAEMSEVQQEIDSIDAAILQLENNDADIMGAMRERAGETGRLFYVVVWLLLIFQTILLLILYYKRLFMLMVLIAIFPLVTIAYVYEKAKAGKSGILKTWTQEYVVNVFIQSIHAILYVTLVEAGYSVFIADNDNWLIFLIAVMALLIMEPIFKKLLGLKASTVSDLAKYSSTILKSAGAAAAVAGVVMNTGKDWEKIENAHKNKEAEIKKKQARSDKRIDTLRQHKYNQINKDSNLSEAEKARRIAEKRDKYARKDEKKEKSRQEWLNRRKRMMRAQKAARLAGNVYAVPVTFAGGLALGGGIEDFSTAKSVVGTISGSGGKVSLSDDAKAMESKANSQVETNTENVPSQVLENTYVPNIKYSGSSYDDYDYGFSSSDTGDRVNLEANIHPTVKATSKLSSNFAKRLEEEKVYINKNYNETIEEKNM